MNPMLVPVLVGGLVIAMVVLFYVALRGNREAASADMLLKQALQEADKKSLLDRLTPGFLNITKTFEQADCNIKPSALFGISLGLAVLGAALCVWLVNIYVAPIGALVFFTLPWVW